MKNKNRFTKGNSLRRFRDLTKKKQIVYPVENIGKELELGDSKLYKIFLEINILTKTNEIKKSKAIFTVIFHASRIKPKLVMKRTKYTLPFFAGLPGFCSKQFMVNESERKFAGRYEWETVKDAKKYAESYALRFMKRRSKPYTIYYQIVDKTTNEIVESSY